MSEKTPRTPADDVALVTKGDLKDAKEDLRREIKLWTGIGLVGGQALASLVASLVTGKNPADQIQSLAGFIF